MYICFPVYNVWLSGIFSKHFSNESRHEPIQDFWFVTWSLEKCWQRNSCVVWMSYHGPKREYHTVAHCGKRTHWKKHHHYWSHMFRKERLGITMMTVINVSNNIKGILFKLYGCPFYHIFLNCLNMLINSSSNIEIQFCKTRMCHVSVCP